MRKLIVLSFAYLASFVSANYKSNSQEFITNAQINNDVRKINNGMGIMREEKAYKMGHKYHNAGIKKAYYKPYSKKAYIRSCSNKKSNSNNFKTNIQVNNDVERVNNAGYAKGYAGNKWRTNSWNKKSNSNNFKTNVQVNNDVERINNGNGRRMLARAKIGAERGVEHAGIQRAERGVEHAGIQHGLGQ